MKIFIMILSLLFAVTAYGEEEADKKADKPDVKYHRMYPDFVTNLDSANNHYVLVRIEVAVNGVEDLQLIKDNEDLLRDRLILMFNGTSPDKVARGSARQAVKKQALKLVQKIMKDETGKPLATNILFTKFQVE